MILDAPPNRAVVPFIRLARRVGIPVVIDFRDMWDARDTPVPWWRWISPSLRRSEWKRRLRREAVLSADHLVLNTAPMMRAMQEVFPALPKSVFSVVPNAFGQVDAVPDWTGNRTAGCSLKIAYTGSLAYGRDDQVGNLICGMAEARRGGGPHVHLTLAGTAMDSLSRLAERQGVADGVRLLGRMTREDAIKLQRDSDVLLLVQPPSAARVAIPGKIFEYMARRRNILGIVGDGPAAELIREHDLGVVVAGESAPEIAHALATMAERVRVKPFLLPPPERFSERHTVAEFARVLDTLLEGGRRF